MGVLVWAHRGASAYLPENTLPSFAKAIEMRADGIELDVQLSKDGEVVVAHDESVSRVSDGEGFLKEYTLSELKAMNFNKTHPEFGPAQIPTLAEVYDLIAPTALTINVEFKTSIFYYEGIVEKVLALTEEWGLEDRVIYSSFNHYTLTKVRMCKPDARTGLLYMDGIIGVASYARDTALVNALHPALYHLQDPDYVKTAHAYGLSTHVWTVDDPQYIRLCRAMGVEAIITNRPDLCRQVLEEV